MGGAPNTAAPAVPPPVGPRAPRLGRGWWLGLSGAAACLLLGLLAGSAGGRLWLYESLRYLPIGVMYGSIYAIVAIGFNIIYNTTGIINFAQGEFVMIGAMTAAGLSGGWHWPLPLAVAGAVLVTMVVGALIEMLFIRWLDRPSVLRLIIITIGLSILIREAALHLWGDWPRTLPYFTGDVSTAISVLGARISVQSLWVLGTCGLIVALLTVFFRYSALGREMRACADNRTAAVLCGINTRNLVTFSFMLSAGIGALAGCVLCPITQSTYNAGTPLAIKGFTVAILGGLGNSVGAVGGGLVLGILEAFSIRALPNAYKDAIAIAILLVILSWRPHGLFGSREAGQLREF